MTPPLRPAPLPIARAVRRPPSRAARRRPLRATAAREALTATRAQELRQRMAAGEFDTPAHAQALAWVLLGRGIVQG